MNNESKVRQEMFETLNSMRTLFDGAVRQFEAGQMQEALGVAKNLVPQLKALSQRVAANYESGLAERTKIESAEKSVESIKAGESLDRNSCLRVLVDMEKSLRQLDREIRFQYAKPWLVTFVAAYGKRIVIVAALALLVLGISKCGTHFKMRKRGLIGKYYAGMNFEKLVTTRQDQVIKFRWGKRSPGHKIPANRFSVRWEGFVVASRPGKYEFVTGSDDGVRLWIDDQKLIDNWASVTRFEQNTGSVELTSGPHKILFEYFDLGSVAAVELKWRHEDEKTAVTIPAENLVPSEKYL